MTGKEVFVMALNKRPKVCTSSNIDEKTTTTPDIIAKAGKEKVTATTMVLGQIARSHCQPLSAHNHPPKTVDAALQMSRPHLLPQETYPVTPVKTPDQAAVCACYPIGPFISEQV